MKINSALKSFVSLMTILSIAIETAEGIIGAPNFYIRQGVRQNNFKYNVAIKINGPNDVCSGVIIGPRHVLSVASCFMNQQNSFKDLYYTVIANTFNLHSTDSTILTVDAIFVSKDFDSSTIRGYSSHSIGNLAVLKLTQTLELGPNSRLDKVNLPHNPATSNYENEPALVSGYGVTAKNTLTVDRVGNLFELCNFLQLAHTKVISNQICQSGFSFPVQEKHLCAKLLQNAQEVGGTCNGDTGSPLVAGENILIGVLSDFQSDCNEKDHGALYTRITPYLDFIRKAMDETPSPSDTRYAVYKNRDTVFGMIGGGMTLQEYYHHI